jgi:galactose-1-phosphate uridylyltransferase
MSITFERETQTASFHSPLEEFELVDVEVELREDPLTGRQTRIVPEAFVEPEETPELPDSVTDSEGCFFCPGTVEEATPEYPALVGFDRGTVGEATSFPNLNPYGDHSNVVVLTEDHYVPIGDLTADILADGLEAAMEYVQAVFEAREGPDIASINMNFLPSAGSSIVHPHLQTLVDDRGTNAQQARFEAAAAYRDDHGTPYFEDLLAATRETDRYVGATGGVEWLAPFAPRHHRHVRGIAPETNVPAPDATVLEDLAAGIEAVLAAYDSQGLNSFNFGIHLSRDDAVPLHVDVVARSVFQEYAWSDATFFETVHDEAVVDVPPEEYADEVATQL